MQWQKEKRTINDLQNIFSFYNKKGSEWETLTTIIIFCLVWAKAICVQN
jgi:hypothetical protein